MEKNNFIQTLLTLLKKLIPTTMNHYSLDIIKFVQETNINGFVETIQQNYIKYWRQESENIRKNILRKTTSCELKM